MSPYDNGRYSVAIFLSSMFIYVCFLAIDSARQQKAALLELIQSRITNTELRLFKSADDYTCADACRLYIDTSLGGARYIGYMIERLTGLWPSFAIYYKDQSRLVFFVNHSRNEDVHAHVWGYSVRFNLFEEQIEGVALGPTFSFSMANIFFQFSRNHRVEILDNTFEPFNPDTLFPLDGPFLCEKRIGELIDKQEQILIKYWRADGYHVFDYVVVSASDENIGEYANEVEELNPNAEYEAILTLASCFRGSCYLALSSRIEILDSSS